MNLSLSGEQQLIKDAFRRLFEKESSIARVRAAAPLGFDHNLWSALVASGAPVARVPTDSGLNMSLLDAALIAEEAGRALISAPLIEVMVAARLLALLGDVGGNWVEKISQGSIVAFAVQPAVNGMAQLVLGGAVAEAVVALDGDELVLVAGPHPEQLPNIGHIPVASWPLKDDEHHARMVLASGEKARSVVHAAIAEWKVLSAAVLAGLARRAVELAADYAGERVQFGRPIGSFQGVAHPLADAATEVDGGQIFIWKAIWAISTGQVDAPAMVSLAWWWIGQAMAKAVRCSMRTLGGYGLCLEYDLQLYHRRGNSLLLLGGDPYLELTRAGDLLFGEAATALPDTGDVGITFSLGEKGEKYAARMTAFFQKNWNDRMRKKAHHSSKSHDPEFHRALGREGLLFGRWPAEYGGTGLTVSEEYAGGNVFEEWNYTTHVISTSELVSAIVMRYATDAAKAEILPRIKSGDAVCSLGFSEPASGSDVFSARTSAVRDGDDWLIKGQKMFTTAGHFADYVLLLTRTDSSGPKHSGLTLFAVPTTLPGYEFQAVETYQDERTNITYYDMRVPDRYRLGPVGEGANVMSAALQLEQGGESYFRAHMRVMKSVLAWGNAPGPDGHRPLDEPSVRARLAKVRARYEIGACFVARGIWASETGKFHRAWGPMSKMFISESLVDNCWDILEMGGAQSILTGDHPLGFIELDHRRAYGMTIYGGANEIHRSIIAEQFLGLPKSRS